MGNLLKSELLKVRSTQVWIWMLVTVAAITVIATLGQTLTISSGTPKEEINYYSIWTSAGTASVALLVIGVLGLTTEFRHKTITPTLLATPNRRQLLVGKALAYVLLAFPYGLVCYALNFVIGIIVLKAKGFPIAFTDGAVGGIITNFLGLILLAFFGLGLGAVVRNQAAGMVIGILYFSVLNLLFASVPYIRKVYLFEPGGAFTAFTTRDRDNYGLASDVIHISPIVGGLIMLAWCLVLLAIGWYFSLNRDIS